VHEELVSRSIELPGGALRLLQPRESAELPDDGPVEWAPMTPYWSVIWRSGVALARATDTSALAGLRVLELGCGMALPSLAAARAGALALATDESDEALELVERNARLNRVELETAVVDWASPGELVDRAPFDVVVAADVLYERASVGHLLSLLPRLAPEAWIADPGRPASAGFFDHAWERWEVELLRDGVIALHRLQFTEAHVDSARSGP
jgi:predicted nicotinamide N-methyase